MKEEKEEGIKYVATSNDELRKHVKVVDAATELLAQRLNFYQKVSKAPHNHVHRRQSRETETTCARTWTCRPAESRCGQGDPRGETQICT